MFGLKIKGDVNTKCISMLRKFESELSLAEIKRRVQEGSILIEQDEFSDDLYKDTTTLEDFADLVKRLIKEGADVIVLEDEEPIEQEIFQNRLEALKEISAQVEEDMERESSF